MQYSVVNGIDNLISFSEPRRYRTALVTNDAAQTADGTYSRIALLDAGFLIKALFSPEHGLTVKGADGSYQGNHIDSETQLPVFSLYGAALMPTAVQLGGIEQVIFDIPDIGCRFYTYLWTMTHVMEACARLNIRFIVADRPNPIGAMLMNAEGPWLDEENCSSFIGRWNIPMKHAATLGELAKYFAATKIPGLKLDVVPVTNYCRNQLAGQNFPFVPTSPAIQHLESALVYPGLGLLEGLNIDEGRGTAFPFGQFGAPWLNSATLLKNLKRQDIEGCKFYSVDYTPDRGIYKNKHCKGIRIEITDYRNFMAVQTGMRIIRSLIDQHPDKIEERAYPTVANPAGTSHLDRLLGVKDSFHILMNGKTLPGFNAPAWEETIQPYLLYRNC